MCVENSNFLLKAALAWQELLNTKCVVKYSERETIKEIVIRFSEEDFYHLAGFQYLEDIRLPRYSHKKVLNRIIAGDITQDMISKGCKYDSFVKPRLMVLIEVKELLEKEFELFSFNQFRCSFYTQLKADYIISNNDDYVFVVKENGSEFECRCCSAFKIAQRNYTNNQKKLKIVSKEIQPA